MSEFNDPEISSHFTGVLRFFNSFVKTIDGTFDDKKYEDEKIKKEIDNFLEEIILDRLFLLMNVFMFRRGYNFLELYERLYWKRMRSFVKDLWTAMPDNKPVVGASKAFNNLFDDFHDNVVNKYPSLFIKQLKDVGQMYRARAWCLNGDYDLMIPNEKYVKDNRWNPDGLAYLYLACGDDTTMYDETINNVQKTCFEEIRLSEGNEVAICQFKPMKKHAKIIDLCYEGTDIQMISRELKVPPKEYSQLVTDTILGDQNLTKKMLGHLKGCSKDEFIRKASPELKKLMNQKNLENKIEELIYLKTCNILLGLIDESIFEVVEKTNDPELNAYIPFRAFSQYLIDKGYDGIIYRSTRMNKIGLSGKNLVLFDKEYATYKDNTMKKYMYSSGKYAEL